MDVLRNDTEHFFLLPAALIFQNELGSIEQNEYSYTETTTGRPDADLNNGGQNWKIQVTSNQPQRLEKIEEIIRKELKWTFILHAYGFGSLFFILAFYTLFSILNLRAFTEFIHYYAQPATPFEFFTFKKSRYVHHNEATSHRLKGLTLTEIKSAPPEAYGGLLWSFISSRPFMSTINGFLCLLGTSRAASLFIDPYNLKENMPRLFGQVLWDLGFPSIISAFSLVQLAFLQFTQLQVGPKGLRKKSCLSLIVSAHFLLTISVDIVASSHENLMIVKHVVHYIFLTWGVFLCSNFLYSGYKIMSMIKNLPEELRHKDLPDCGYKGILQLAMLAPHNNLAGSMTAALLPTLCAPKIHLRENTNLSSVGFKNDGNSRILESESIPMLEELIGSSGDEICPKPLVRTSSYQNQTRQSQKFNTKPKLHFKSVSDDLKYSELNKRKRPDALRDQRSIFPNIPFIKTDESKEFSSKSVSEIFKRKENLLSSQSAHELKRKLEERTCFENENFRFAIEKEEFQTFSVDGSVPEILITRPISVPEVVECTGEKALSKLMREISKDLNEMQILREDEADKSEQPVKIHECLRKAYDAEQESSSKSKSGIFRCRDSETECTSERKRNTVGDGSNRTNDCNDVSVSRTAIISTSASSADDTCIRECEKFDETPVVSLKTRGKKKAKSLSWQKKPKETEEEKALQECLLQQKQSTDATLRTDLASIHTNRTNSDDDSDKIRKSKVEWVLNITYITAMWGLMLCLSHMGKIYSSFGLPEPRRTSFRSNSTLLREGTAEQDANQLNGGMSFSPWPWLWFQTFRRALELAMGCAMANITRQPTASSRYPRSLTSRHRNTFYNI